MTTVLDRFRLDDKVAIVTGASSGLGVAFAKALAEAGADLVLAARRVERLRALPLAAGPNPVNRPRLPFMLRARKVNPRKSNDAGPS